MRCLTNSSANQKHRQGIHEAWLDRELVLGFTWTGVIQVLLSTPVQFWIGARFYVGAWKALTHGSANMDVLVVLGTSAAYFYSLVVMVLAAFRDGFEAHLFFETAVFLIVFILLGKFMETTGSRNAKGGGVILRFVPLPLCLLSDDLHLVSPILAFVARGKTSEAITKLMGLTATEAVLLTERANDEGGDGADGFDEEVIDLSLLQKGDRLKV